MNTPGRAKDRVMYPITNGDNTSNYLRANGPHMVSIREIVKYSPRSTLTNLRRNVDKYLTVDNLNLKASPSKNMVNVSDFPRFFEDDEDVKITIQNTNVERAVGDDRPSTDISQDILTKEMYDEDNEELKVNQSNLNKFVKRTRVMKKAKVRPQTGIRSKNEFSTPYLNRLNKAKMYSGLQYSANTTKFISQKDFLQTYHSGIFEGPAKEVVSASTIPRKVITRYNRMKNIHPMYRNQWKQHTSKQFNSHGKSARRRGSAKNLLQIQHIPT